MPLKQHCMQLQLPKHVVLIILSAVMFLSLVILVRVLLKANIRPLSQFTTCVGHVVVVVDFTKHRQEADKTLRYFCSLDQFSCERPKCNDSISLVLLSKGCYDNEFVFQFQSSVCLKQLCGLLPLPTSFLKIFC